MWRLRSHDAEHVAFPRPDDQTLPEHDVAPPTTEWQKLDEAFFRHGLHEEPHLVEVAGEHDAGAVGRALLLADEAAEPVARGLADALEAPFENRRDVGFEARSSVGLEQ